jgi:hypothetical protein
VGRVILAATVLAALGVSAAAAWAWFVLLATVWDAAVHDTSSSTAAIGVLYVPVLGLILLPFVLLAAGAVLAAGGYARDRVNARKRGT